MDLWPSITQARVHIRAVHGSMAAGRPTCPHLQKLGMVRVADENVAGGNSRSLRLGVATQAQIWIVIHEQLFVDGTVRVMTNHAAFA